MIITLSTPLKYKDSQLSQLDLDLHTLTGRDLINAEETLKRSGVQVAAWEFSRQFLLEVAAKALHMPSEVLKDLSAGDFTRVINEVLSFLAGAGYGETMPTTSEAS